MKIAAAAYPLDWMQSFSEYEEKLDRWVSEAAGNGADLLLFPGEGHAIVGRGTDTDDIVLACDRRSLPGDGVASGGA